MKRQTAIFICALLIIVFVSNIIIPSHAAAQQHGNVTIGGQVLYQPRYWNGYNWGVGREIQVDLYEKDLNGHDHYLDTTYTDVYGQFYFPPRENWWYEDNRQLNIYFKVITVYADTAVTDVYFRNYAFVNSPAFLYHDGDFPIDFPISSGWVGSQALWIFEDIRNAWNFVHTHYSLYNPGPVTAVWEQNLNCYPLGLPDYVNICNSFTYAGSLPPRFIFITSDDNIQSMDVVLHETGHMYVVNANGWWYVNTNCFYHVSVNFFL
jgi:hypothetical protein